MTDNLFPSSALSAIVGPTAKPKPMIFVRILNYVDEHGLRDPSDPLYVLLDAKMRAMFGKDRMSVSELERNVMAHVV